MFNRFQVNGRLVPSELYYRGVVGHHKNIIRVHEFCSNQSCYVLVLERPKFYMNLSELSMSKLQTPLIRPQIRTIVIHCVSRGVRLNVLNLKRFIYDFDTGLVKLNDFDQAELVRR